MARQEQPYGYEWQRYCEAGSAARRHFGEGAVLLEPRNPQLPAYQGTPKRELIDAVAAELGVEYKDFAREALVRTVQHALKPPELEGDWVVGVDGASIWVPLAPSTTTEGELPYGVLVHAIDAHAFSAGNRDYDIARLGDTSRVYWPSDVRVSTVNGPGDDPRDTRLLARYSLGFSNRSETWFMLRDMMDFEYSEEGRPLDLPAHSGFYGYLAGLMLDTYEYALANPGRIEVNPGAVDTLNQLNARIDALRVQRS